MLRGLRLRRRGIPWRAAVVAATVATVVATVGAVPVSAIPIDPTHNPCVSNSSGTVSVSTHSLALGQSTTVSWSLTEGAGCGPMTPYIVFVDAVAGRRYVQPLGTVQPGGTTVVTPQASGSYVLSVFNSGFFYDMGSGSVSVTLPVVNGHPSASITGGGEQAALFAQGASTPNAVVSIRGDVNLDMSWGRPIVVAPGVLIFGQRDAGHPSGPRLFTTTFQRQLLSVGVDESGLTSDNVRITGIRFDGGESSDPCDEAGLTNDSDAIDVFSSQHVEIDHNEFYRWNGSAVNVNDAGNRINRDNSDTVWVHDNWIHDNQHPTYCGLDPTATGHGGGYGVSVNVGGFPKIEHNVFDSNRHAIAANGHAGDGYTLIGNLFLNPGIDDVKLGVTNFNHQIDVHGKDTCPDINHESYNCGDAGEYFYVASNTVVGAGAAAIQLRGKPTSYVAPSTGGMYVVGNIFSHGREEVLTQTQTGLVDGGQNAFSSFIAFNWDVPTPTSAPCDFDGDGVNDQFRASGASWWYKSSRANHWVALDTAQSTTVTFSDVNHDGLCDVTSSGVTRLTKPLLVAIPTVPASDYSIGLGPQSGTVVRGGSVSTAVNLTAINGFVDYAALSISGLPSGVTAALSLGSVSVAFGATLTLTTASSTPAGQYTITVTGTAGSLSHQATYNLTVTGTGTVTVTKPADQLIFLFDDGTTTAAPLQVIATDSKGLPLTFTATGLPFGMVISSSGLITGNPTIAAAYTATLTATDSGGASGATTIGYNIIFTPAGPF